MKEQQMREAEKREKSRKERYTDFFLYLTYETRIFKTTLTLKGKARLSKNAFKMKSRGLVNEEYLMIILG